MRLLKVLLVCLLVITIGLSAVSFFYRHVVMDTTAPVLVSDREVLELSVTDEKEALFLGLTATDDRDGDITDRIIIDHISHLIDTATVRITYVVFDNTDHFAKLTRTIHYADYTPPVFQLEQPLVFSLGQSVFISSKLRAFDCLDGDISSDIQITTQDLNLNQPGLYNILVQANNSLGDTVTLPLQVLIVQGNNLPEIELSDYLVYVEQGSKFTPRDYIVSAIDPAADEESQNISKTSIRTLGSVDTKTPGVYTVQFSCNGIYGTGYTMLTVVVE